MCYKDVNEGNIFFNPQNGDIRIIDNDNIGYADKFTIKGTNGYMAPEVVLGDKPDTRSDMFSFAVFVYRLLVGGFPFEGPYTEQYCVKIMYYQMMQEKSFLEKMHYLSGIQLINRIR